MRVRAVVFDFDGTIIDTETAVYEAWRSTFEHFGTEPISLEVWLEHIGKADGAALDLEAVLSERLGLDSLPDEIHRFRRAARDEILLVEPIRAGVEAWIEAAESQGLGLAVASSSSSAWVRPHLERIGLAKHFPIVCCADPGTPGKPDPTVYLQACVGLGSSPDSALAIEDSPHGVSAALAAGLRCLAVPGPMTRVSNFDHATERADSLEEFDPRAWLS